MAGDTGRERKNNRETGSHYERLAGAYLEQEGYEGDDIIGTLARGLEKENLDIAVVTGDRDALQLVDDSVTVHLTKKGITNMLAVPPQVMEEEYG